MQCIILAAGKGTRMMPLTEDTPKPVLEVAGKPILQHIVEALPEEIDELIIVTHYLEEQIENLCGEEYLGKRVQYCHQANPAGGTGDALLCAKNMLTGRFLFMYGDDIHGAEALRQAVSNEHAIMGAHSDTPERFGVLMANEDGTLKEIVEKPKNPQSNTVNIGGFVLDTSIFNYSTPVSTEHGELLVTDMLTAYAADNPVMIVEQDLWLPLGCPEDIPKAEAVLASIEE